MFGVDTDLIKVILMVVMMSGNKGMNSDEAETLLRALYTRYGVDWE